jgi:hypothetical protein
LEEKGKLILVIKDGLFRAFDVFNEMQVVKTFNMMWHDISALDMRSDELMVVGHESGMIYT